MQKTCACGLNAENKAYMLRLLDPCTLYDFLKLTETEQNNGCGKFDDTMIMMMHYLRTKLIQPARGWCATVGREESCIHLSRLPGGPATQEARPPRRPGHPGGPATQFFLEACHAIPQHGWQCACSLRETLSPTQD